MKKVRIFIFILLTISVVLIWFFLIPAPKRPAPTMKLSSQGYAPYKMSMHKNWVPDDRKESFIARRKISPDLPKSMFELQVLDLVKATGKSKMTISDYIDTWWLAGMRHNDNSQILNIKDTSIDALAAKDIICTYTLTHQNITRELKCRWIIFIAGNYIYNFVLVSFPKDFDTANIEYERMVKSFRFDLAVS